MVQVSPNKDLTFAHVQLSDPDNQKKTGVLRRDEISPNHITLTGPLFQKCNICKKHLDAVNDSIYRKFYKELGNQTRKQRIVEQWNTQTTIENNIRTKHRDPMWKNQKGNPGSSKMFHTLWQQYHSDNTAQKVQRFVNNCRSVSNQNFMQKANWNRRYNESTTHAMARRTSWKSIHLNNYLTPMVLPKSWLQMMCFCAFFWRSNEELDSPSVVEALKQSFTWDTFVPRHIITDKSSALKSQIDKDLMEASISQIEYPTMKYAQTIGMIGQSHKKLNQKLQTKVDCDSLQWDRYKRHGS